MKLTTGDEDKIITITVRSLFCDYCMRGRGRKVASVEQSPVRESQPMLQVIAAGSQQAIQAKMAANLIGVLEPFNQSQVNGRFTKKTIKVLYRQRNY